MSNSRNPTQRTSCFPFVFVASLFGICHQPWAAVTIAIDGEFRTIISDGMPDHPTGQFPGPGNPNRISAQSYKFRMPAKPKAAATTTALTMSPFGVALNGVVFDPFAAEWWNQDRSSGWQVEPMSGLTDSLGIDESHAHVQPSGAYHYHGIPTGFLSCAASTTKPVHLGYAADGFPIYAPFGFTSKDGASSGAHTLKSSYGVKSGIRPNGPGGTYDGRYIQDYEYVPGKGDLDECNGRLGVTPEFPQGSYYYVITESFPYIPRCYYGTPDSSFIRQRPGGPGGPGGRGGQRPTNRPGRSHGISGPETSMHSGRMESHEGHRRPEGGPPPQHSR